MNAVLAIVHIQPGDKIVKEKEPGNTSTTSAPAITPSTGAVKEELKEENGSVAVKEEGTDIKSETEEAKDETKEDAGEDQGENKVDKEEDMDDEVPYIEDIGTREVAGFIVM